MSDAHGHVEGNDEAKQAHLKRLRRIEGQVRGIQRMVDDEQYCIDVLTQVSAVTKALQSLALSLLDDHMAHCVVDAARKGGAEQEAKLKEASAAIARLVKSSEENAMSETSTYTVTGMTCEHCVASVTEEISELDGVEAVDVVLDSGQVTVTSSQPLDPAAVQAAVEEAGYALA